MKNKAANKLNIFKKGDIILVLVFVALIVLTVVFSVKDTKSTEAIVYVDGQVYQYIDMSKDGEYKILDRRMTVLVSKGSLSVADSDCPEKICVHSSSISKDGGMIVCLPNRVMIKTVSKEVDAIT